MAQIRSNETILVFLLKEEEFLEIFSRTLLCFKEKSGNERRVEVITRIFTCLRSSDWRKKIEHLLRLTDRRQIALMILTRKLSHQIFRIFSLTLARSSETAGRVHHQEVFGWGPVDTPQPSVSDQSCMESAGTVALHE